jgi:hypothetical protein
MRIKIHKFKTDPFVFEPVFRNQKNFEIRFNDRNYHVGDRLILQETEFSGYEMANGKPLKYTGRECERVVGYILQGPIYGLEAGWVIMSIS